jgi:hypothetical protein
MQKVKFLSVLMVLSAVMSVQAGQQPYAAAKVVIENRPASIQVDSRLTTTVRMPEPVNSVVLGDSTLFHAEYSPNEPMLVFVRSLSATATESNLVISTTRGRQFILILKSVDGAPDKPGKADLLVTCKLSGGLFIEDGFPGSLIAEAVRIGERGAAPKEDVIPTDQSVDDLALLNELLGRQRKTPLSGLTGDRIRVSIGQVIEQGSQLIVLFSLVGPDNAAVELMPPQVQLAGRTNSGILRRTRWTTAQQLPVEKWVITSRRLPAGGRADGVVVFERPALKQSTQELLLQIADSAAIDKPALAPISFRSTNLSENNQ